MLELAILGLLKEQELHGYELKKRLSDTLGVASGVSFGSLYPALARLERAGAVVSSVEGSSLPAAIPNTGSLGGELAAFRARPPTRGRSRKVYAVTARGEALFEELLRADSPAGEDIRTFNLRLAFARYLPSEARLGLFERRRAHLLERLRRSASGSRVGSRIDAYLHSLMEHDREATEHDLSWIEQLIASERAAAPAPAAPAAAAAAAAPASAAATAATARATGAAGPDPGQLTAGTTTSERHPPGDDLPEPSTAGLDKEST